MARTRKEPAISAKRGDIVRAATQLFSRHGFRKTSIDLIATEAQVAKPTVYAHFEDKDALFAAVCREVTDRVLRDAEDARTASRHAVDRIAGMLSAKFTTVFELVESSPHARELLDSRNEEARAIVDAADGRFFDLLCGELRRAVKAGELALAAIGVKPPELARLLMQAAHGAGYGATSADEHRTNVRRLVALALAGAARHGGAGRRA
jgi:AcrR family transcriptional regulator